MLNDEEIALTDTGTAAVQQHEPPHLRKLQFTAAALVGCFIGILLGIRLGEDYRADGVTYPLLQNGLHGRSAPVNFLVIGDWGRDGQYNQSLLAQQMAVVARRLDTQFVVSTGDNFYETGLKGPDDPQFDTSFTQVYSDPALQTPWLSVLGNHDYLGDTRCQIDGSLTRRDPRWFCERAFTRSWPLCGTDQDNCRETLDIFFFDTSPFITSYHNSNIHHFNWDGLLPWDEQLPAQLTNLTQALESSTARWKLVVGHHTIRSHGEHGDGPELIAQLVPILEKYGVNAYINGHDHDVEHIKRDDSPVHYITSGGGSKAYRKLKPAGPEDGQLFVDEGQGFISVSVAKKWLHIDFYGVSDVVMHSLELWK